MHGFALVMAVVGTAWHAIAAELPLVTPDAAYREVGRSGALRGAHVTGDVDLSRLQAPTGVSRIVLQDVRVEGRVHSTGTGPAVPLSIEGAVLQRLDLRGARLRAGFALDRTTVKDAARFDDAEFDGAFVLHAGTLSGGAVFRRARFGGSVEIVAMQFDRPAGTSGGVSFVDARFAGPARFDRSRFTGDVLFDTSRFEADASFVGLVVPGLASWRNVIFSRDAEFRFCRLGNASFGGDATFGDAEHMTVFGGLADFRGCTMRSARFDYVDARGEVMLVNVRVAGDLTLRHAALRGGRSDLTGLRVDGGLDLGGAHISALQFRWPEVAGPLRRAQARSDVLRSLHQRLEALGQKDEALTASAALAEQVFRERLASPDVDAADKAGLWLEWVFWGWPTGYGTRLGRIAVLTVAAWLVLTLPLLVLVWPRARLGSWRGSLSEAPPRHRPAPSDALTIGRAASVDRALHLLVYSFGLMFATPGLRLRPAAPLSRGLQTHLTAMRGIGALLLALLALTLANVSPVFQAILGKVVG